MAGKKDIFVYADWAGLQGPLLMGMLYSERVKGKEIFSFSYDKEWLDSGYGQFLDPSLQLFTGPQYPAEEATNFGLFLDSSPDRWGRLLMRRRESVLARQEKRKENTLFETDYLLGVYDGHRMGGLRFKINKEGDFLDNNATMASPPMASLRELEHASRELEKAGAPDSPNFAKWLNMLVIPGASLGGARPKAGVSGHDKEMWIAKFPSNNDDIDIGGWEMVANELAIKAGVHAAEGMVKQFSKKGHTFLTKRFDRTNEGERIHFASAMTLLGLQEGNNQADGISYLHIAEFIMQNGANVNSDLEELWRRIVFNICISNTDDHLRNHGFLLTPWGWTLSPAYDMNPVEHGSGLQLNISLHDNTQDPDIAMEVAKEFRIDNKRARKIIQSVQKSVQQWPAVAKSMGLSKSEQARMARAFRYSG